MLEPEYTKNDVAECIANVLNGNYAEEDSDRFYLDSVIEYNVGNTFTLTIYGKSFLVQVKDVAK